MCVSVPLSCACVCTCASVRTLPRQISVTSERRQFAFTPADKKDLKRLIDSIQGQIQVRGELQLVGMSIGVAFFPEDAEDASKLLEHADQAMYWAKREGKNRHVEFHPK